MRTYIKILFIFIVLLSICKNGSSQPHNAFSFDGVDDWLSIADKAQNRLANKFTIEFWIKSNNLNNPGSYITAKYSGSVQHYAIIYEYLNDNLEFYSSFALTAGSTDPRPGSAIPLADMNWHHIAYTYDGTVFKGYKDGVLIFSNTISFTLLPMVGSQWYVGAANTASGYADVQIDEYRIWNRALCSAELNNNMNCELVGNESGLVAYYDFNVGTASGNNVGTMWVPDKTSYANDMYIPQASWMALSGTTSNFVTGTVNSACSPYVPTPITINGFSSPICARTSLSLTATSGFSQYNWNTGATTSSITISPPASTVYSVSAVGSNGCVSTRSLNVVTIGGPKIITQSADTLKTNLTYTPTYQWLDCKNSKQPISGATQSFIKGSNNGSYALVTNISGCIDTSACVTINPPAGSMDFDGVNDYIRLNDNAATRITKDFTIEFRMKLNVANQTNKYILTRNNASGQWAIIYGFVSNTLELYTSGGGVTSGNPRASSRLVISDTLWHHVAYTYNGVVLRGYIDGNIIIANATVFSLAPMAGVNWFVGSSGSANFTNMKMDELRVWNKRLTISEIQGIMNCELNGNENGLVAYYNFNSGYVNADNTFYNSLIDKSPTANNGALINIALQGSTSNWSNGIINNNACLTILPIELQSFSCQNINSDNTQLTWVTASEKNTSYFEIEKSFDGINFKTIGKVNSIKESYQTQHYIFNDVEQDAHNDFSYYRLKMVDQDNTFKYSEICSTNKNIESSKSELMIYPNPANTFLFIRYEKESINDLKFLKLTNIRGDEVHVLYDYHEDGIRLNVANIDAGMYFVFVNSNNTNHQLRFIKQN